MLDCRAGNKATVKWDVRTQAGVEKVQVFVTASKGKNKGSEKLFVIGSRVGSAETGNWLFAGSQLSLRDLATGKELANILVDDSACRGAAATPAAGA